MSTIEAFFAEHTGPLAVRLSNTSESVRVYAASGDVFTAAGLDESLALFTAAGARRLWSEDAALMDRDHAAFIAALGQPRIYCALTVDRALAPQKGKATPAPGTALARLMEAHKAAPKAHRVIAMGLEADCYLWRGVARAGYTVDAYALTAARQKHTRVMDDFARSATGVEIRTLNAWARNAAAVNPARNAAKAAWLAARGIGFDQAADAKWAEPSRCDTSAMPEEFAADWAGYEAAYQSMHRLTPLDSLRKRVGTDGVVHPLIRLNQAVTGRASVSEPGLQNLPHKRQSTRHVIKVAEGYAAYVSVDHSNAELRVLARLIDNAGFTKRVEGDLYQEIADAAGVGRSEAKWQTIAYMYSMNERTLAREVGAVKAAAMHSAIRNVVPEITGFCAEVTARAEKGEKLETLFGRPLPVLDGRGFETRFALATNLLVQGSARDAWGLAVRRTAAALGAEAMRGAIPLHDELFLMAPHGRSAEYAAVLLESMTVDLGHGVVLRGKSAVTRGRWAPQ